MIGLGTKEDDSPDELFPGGDTLALRLARRGSAEVLAFLVCQLGGFGTEGTGTGVIATVEATGATYEPAIAGFWYGSITNC